jgi:hypothetical protein
MPINNYLNQSVTLKQKSGFSLEGKPTLSVGTTIKARFQDKQKRLVDDVGNEYFTDAEVWLKPTQTINLDDVVVYGSVSYKVVQIDTKRGLNGQIDHKKALVVKTKE